MSISFYNMKKWFKMLTGKSILHVNQDMGKYYSKCELRGYYNNLTEKVTKDEKILRTKDLPRLTIDSGEQVEFSIAIFQYGLGAYDLYLQENQKIYYEKFIVAADWAISHQGVLGEWNTFFYIYPETPYSAMAQGEGASLLLRAYKETGKEHYLTAAKKAVDFMLKDVQLGGTTKYDNKNVYLLEYTHRDVVLNGWIFAYWGLYDLNKVVKSPELSNAINSIETTLVQSLSNFDCIYWSKYDLGNRLASPFYHHLHIAQMKVMFDITGRTEFDFYAKRWEKKEKNWLCKAFAFCVKAAQKVFERI